MKGAFPAAGIAAAFLTFWQALTTPPDRALLLRARRQCAAWSARVGPRPELSPVAGVSAIGLTLGAAWGAQNLCAVPAITALAGLVAGAVPGGVARRRYQDRRQRRREAWPDAVDHLVGAVRTGLSLPDAWRLLAKHGPAILSDEVTAVVRREAAGGSWTESLTVLDGEGDAPSRSRLVAGLQLASSARSTDRENVLALLSVLLRADLTRRPEVRRFRG